MWRIVLMEESQVLRGQWRRALMREGFEIEEAATGNQLFAILLEKHVDLIILDLFLGSEHGFHVIKRLKQDPNFCNIPIMIASPERRRASILEVIDEGIVDYLIKPMDVDLLVRRIKRLHKRMARPNQAERSRPDMCGIGGSPLLTSMESY